MGGKTRSRDKKKDWIKYTAYKYINGTWYTVYIYKVEQTGGRFFLFLPWKALYPFVVSRQQQQTRKTTKSRD